MPSYNPNSIWDSKEKKYSYEAPNPQKPAPKKTSENPQRSNEVPEQPSFYHRHRLAFFAAGLLLGLGLITLVVYLLLPPAAPNIVISFSDPGSVVIGQPFPLSITVSNESKSVLQNAELNVILPPGFSFVGQDPGQQGMTEQIDTLSSQTINPPEDLKLIATGASSTSNIAGTSQGISVKLTYQTAETNNTQYETDASTNIVIGQEPAITLTPTAPSSIFSGENFDLVMNYENNTTSTLQGVQLAMQYPPAYTFAKSSLAPSNTADNMWNVSTLAPNATGTITITGNITGPAGAPYQLSVNAIENFSGKNYSLYPAQLINFSVAAAPLSIAITLNNSSTYTSKQGDSLNYTLKYSNNSNVAFQGLNIQVTLTGQMYDFSSVKSNGSFNSNADTISWNAGNTPQLLSLGTGQSGSVNFSINTKSAFPIASTNSKNYLLEAAAQIESPTVPPNTAGSSTISATTLTTKVGGSITVGATGYSQEPTTAIKNSGPYPPKANTPTEYTIHWDITNYSTDASSVTVSAYLQSGTTFTGQVESNIASSTPIYNPTTGLVSWTIPYVPATTGVIGPRAEAIFQVSNTPSITQVGQNVTLLGPTTLSATDMFTGQRLNTSANAITTQLQDDTSIESDNRTVTQ